MSQTLAILGANSQIARDLIRAMVVDGRHRLLLYVRDVPAMKAWLHTLQPVASASVHGYESYDDEPHDAVLNFVGVGDPQRAREMGNAIFEVTQHYDGLALEGLRRCPSRRYLFLSSGAVYGEVFQQPVTATTCAAVAINDVPSFNWYAVAKLHAEMRHRALMEMSIVDLRVFNYFSRTQDLSARFFVTDLMRAIRTGETVSVSADFMVRDYLHPTDFHQLVERVLAATPFNAAIDCYSAAPIDKTTLLLALRERFGLRYEIAPSSYTVAINATGAKPHYYSLNRKAEHFGYTPAYSSIAAVLEEASALLG
jgi:nucleoside-diphosphate-sugar epimerase